MTKSVPVIMWRGREFRGFLAPIMRTTFAFALVGALLVAFPVQAQEDARALFQRGQTAYQQGDYDAAIQSWNRAFELDPRPLIQFNLSQAYERLGRLDDAAAALDRYLQAADPNDQYQADARARRAAIRERLARTGITLTGGPEGATILIDGEDKGRTPHPDPISVSPGSHRIVVRREGFRDFQASVGVPAGEMVSVTVEMEEGGGGGGGGGGEVSGGGGPGIAPWIVVGAGGALLIGGAILGAMALSAADAAVLGTGPEDDARTLALVADILGIAGGVAIAGGLVWFFVASAGGGGDDSESEATTGLDLEIVPAIGPTVAGAVVRGRL